MLTINVLGRNCETFAEKPADALEAVAAENPAANGATIHNVRPQQIF